MAQEKCGEKDSVITWLGIISGCKCVIVAFEPLFMMGSMGIVAGEKVIRAFKFTIKKKFTNYNAFSFWWCQNSRRRCFFNTDGKNVGMLYMNIYLTYNEEFR